MKKRMKKVATLCLAGVTAMSTVGVTGSAVFAKGDTNYDVDNMRCRSPTHGCTAITRISHSLIWDLTRYFLTR